MRAWLTPSLEILSNPLECRRISVPGDLWYLVQGALELLCMEQNWEEYGGATSEEMAQYFMNVLDEFSQSECAEVGAVFNWLDDINYDVINGFHSTSINVFDLITENLPEEAREATALYVNVAMSFPAAGGSVRVDLPNGNARQVTFFEPLNGQVSFTVMVPNPARFTVLGGDGTARPFIVYVVGWV